MHSFGANPFPPLIILLGLLMIQGCEIMQFIDPRDLNIRGILSPAQDAYKVPAYQRPYAWKEDQWEELFDDIESLKENEAHFLGSMVVVPQGEHRAGVNYFEIVDGQQRLATILIWLSAIRDIAKKDGLIQLANHINSTFLFSKDFQGAQEVEIPKLSLGNLDEDAFNKILKGDAVAPNSSIFECYDYFARKTTTLGHLEKLLAKVLDSVYLVHINAFTHLNAFRLFETLNDRGLELSAVDLIKNFILMQIASDKKTFDKVIEQWNEMYDKIGSDETVRFIRRYTLSKYKGKVPETRLYETIKAKLSNLNPAAVLDFVSDLNIKASVYKKILEKGFASTKINNVLSDLSLIEVGPSYTLLLKLFPFHEAGQLSENNILQILRMIETFHIRWGICGQSTSSLDQIYNDLSVELVDKPCNFFASHIKERFTKELRTGADDIAFERNFMMRTFRSVEYRTKYILWKFSEPTGETTLNLSEIQTEHVMPQTLSVEWYEYLKEETGKNTEEIKALWNQYLNRAGNLAIMKGTWNGGNSNRLFGTKTNDYNNSEFSATRKLTEYPKWTFSEIEHRSKDMAKKAIEIWKWEFGPIESEMTVSDYEVDE